MTWRKTGMEFDHECADVGLSNGAYRTHMEGIGYIYTAERTDCRIPKRNIRRVAGSETYAQDIRELIDHGFWVDRGDEYEVMHHGDVIRQSLAAQQKQRATSKKTSQKYRQKKAAEQASEQCPNPDSGTTDVTRHVPRHAVSQSDIQTDKQQLEGGGDSTTCVHGETNGAEIDPWTEQAVCPKCEANRRRSA